MESGYATFEIQVTKIFSIFFFYGGIITQINKEYQFAKSLD